MPTLEDPPLHRQKARRAPELITGPSGNRHHRLDQESDMTDRGLTVLACLKTPDHELALLEQVSVD